MQNRGTFHYIHTRVQKVVKVVANHFIDTRVQKQANSWHITKQIPRSKKQASTNSWHFTIEIQGYNKQANSWHISLCRYKGRKSRQIRGKSLNRYYAPKSRQIRGISLHRYKGIKSRQIRGILRLFTQGPELHPRIARRQQRTAPFSDSRGGRPCLDFLQYLCFNFT